MTKFLYIADTHLGAPPIGYQQQQRYPERLTEIVAGLNAYLQSMPDIDFVLHGGDMIDSTSDENILAAAELFQLPVPLYLCLGNHDLTTPNALDRWLALAPAFFPTRNPEFTIQNADCVIHVIPNQWHDIPYYWEEAQELHFTREQKQYLDDQLNRMVHLPHILLTHSPIFGLPTEQTGLSEPFHAPLSSFTGAVTNLAKRYPNLQVVLGAHNHMNMRIHQSDVEHGGVEYVTVSALVETPFEFKVFDVTQDAIAMSTVSLVESLNFDHEYDATRSFVQG